MKIFLILFLILSFQSVFADTCSSPISRTNNSANSILTSTKYNLDHNTAYTQINALPGTCISDETIGIDELNRSSNELGGLINSVRDGCQVTYATASQITLGLCRLGVSSSIIDTTSSVTVGFGSSNCSGCDSEVASSQYYLYALGTSTGDTVALSILTTAPDAKGESTPSKKVLARFYNDASSNIDQYSIDQWNGYRFQPQATGWVSGDVVKFNGFTTNPTKASAASIDSVAYRRIGGNMQVAARYSRYGNTGAAAGSGDYLVLLPGIYQINTEALPAFNYQTTNEGSGLYNNVGTVGTFHLSQSGHIATGSVLAADSRRVKFCSFISSGGGSDLVGCIGGGFADMNQGFWGFDALFSVPIIGWND